MGRGEPLPSTSPSEQNCQNKQVRDDMRWSRGIAKHARRSSPFNIHPLRTPIQPASTALRWTLHTHLRTTQSALCLYLPSDYPGSAAAMEQTTSTTFPRATTSGSNKAASDGSLPTQSAGSVTKRLASFPVDHECHLS